MHIENIFSILEISYEKNILHIDIFFLKKTPLFIYIQEYSHSIKEKLYFLLLLLYLDAQITVSYDSTLYSSR